MNSGEVVLALCLLSRQQLAQDRRLPLQPGEDLCHRGREAGHH